MVFNRLCTFSQMTSMDFPDFLTHDSRTVITPKYLCGKISRGCAICTDRHFWCPTCENNECVPQLTCIPRGKFRRRQCINSGFRFSLRFHFKRLADLIVISTYLLTLIPTTLSQPVLIEKMEDAVPRWLNPCGNNSDQESDEGGLVSGSITNDEIYEHIISEARISLLQAEQFKHDYVSSTFRVGFDEHHKNWKGNHLHWLPKHWAKDLGGTSNEEHLRNLVIRNTLRDIYEFLQKIAAGLEQVLLDQRQYEGRFIREFENAYKTRLMVLLCEIKSAMGDFGVDPKPDITREIMDDSVRNLVSASHRNVRDWLIFRDYMNALEYVIEVFTYFKEQL